MQPDSHSAQDRSEIRLPWPVPGFVLSLLALAGLLLSGPCSRLGWWHFRTGFVLLRDSAYAGLIAAALSLCGLALGQGRGRLLALSGLLVGGFAFAVPWNWQRVAHSVPPIHDITTDPQNPPLFQAVLPLRKDAANPAEYGGPEIAERQRAAYPDIVPLELSETPDAAFSDALRTAQSLGWRIVASDPASGRIEATDTTPWFGFKDDIVVRVAPDGPKTRVDVRSVSRVGKGDAGTNARRVRQFLSRLKKKA